MDVASRTAYDLGDIAAVRELLAMIDDCRPGTRHQVYWPNACWSMPASLTATSPGRQRCQPLLDRVVGLTPAELRIGARW